MSKKLLTAALLMGAAFPAFAAEDLTPEALLPGHEATDAYRPAMAFGNGVYLVVWESGRNEKADIVGARVDKSGKVLDAKPFVVSGAKDEQARPQVASDGKGFLVVWQDLRGGKDYDTYAARVSAEGKVLDAEGIPIAVAKDNQCQPVVCWEGSAYQVVWRGYAYNPGDAYDMWGVRVSPAGKLLDAKGVMLLPRDERLGRTYGHPPGVGSDGKGNVVVGARLGTGMGLVAVRGNKPAGKPVNLDLRSHWEPRFTSDGEKVLVLFTTTRPMGRGGTAKTCSGAMLLDPRKPKGGSVIALSTAKVWKSAGVRNPSGAWDGKTYVVAWDVKSGPSGTLGERAKKWPHDRVYARRVTKDGKATGGMLAVAGKMTSPARHAWAASGGQGTTLIVYERHPETAETPIRIGMRMLK